MMFLSEASKKKVSFFTALCMICSMAEMLIPKPSFIKIGFSNIPVMLALSYGFSVKEYVSLVILRIICQALLNGTVFSYAFVMSASAGIASAATMYLAFKIPGISFVGLSETGAFFSNIIQLYVARVFLGNGVFYLAPAILGTGIVTSFVLGVMTPAIKEKINIDGEMGVCNLPINESVSESNKNKYFQVVKYLFGFAIMATTLFSHKLLLNFAVFMLFFICCIIAGKKVNTYLSLMVIFQAVLLALIIPNGKVIFRLWILPITEDSLMLGLRRAFILLSSVYFSRFMVPDKNSLHVGKHSMIHMILFFFGKLSESKGIENHRNT